MNFRKIVLLVLAAFLIFVAAQQVVTLRDEQHSWSIMGWTIKLQGPYIKRSVFTTGTRNSDTEFIANDFNVSFHRVQGIEISKSAGAYIEQQGAFKVIEQTATDLVKDLFPTSDLDKIFNELENLNGGIK